MKKNVNFLILLLFALFAGNFMYADTSLEIEDYEKYVKSNNKSICNRNEARTWIFMYWFGRKHAL